VRKVVSLSPEGTGGIINVVWGNRDWPGAEDFLMKSGEIEKKKQNERGEKE